MANQKAIDVRQEHLELVKEILKKQLTSDIKVLAYGSRAKWQAKDHSDLDLMLEHKLGDKIPFKVTVLLQTAFEESDLPWKVDINDWNSISDSFKAAIEKQRIELELGWDMSTDWPLVKVEEITSKEKYSCVGGPFGSSLSRKHYVEEKAVPVIRGKNLNGDKFIDEDFVYVSEEKGNELYRNMAYPGEIVFTQRGTLGQVAILPKNVKYKRYVVSQSQMKLKVDESVAVPYFVYSFFRTKYAKNEIANRAIVGGVPHINLGLLKALELPLPPLNVQKIITTNIKALDQKIETNHQINQTLEQIAQAIFKSWFVDFEPVKAKIAAREALLATHTKQGTTATKQQIAAAEQQAAINAISGATTLWTQEEEQRKQPLPSAGVPTDDVHGNASFAGDTLSEAINLSTLADLFPNQLVTSELGEIPAGWGVVEYRELLRVPNIRVNSNEITLENYISTENMLENKQGIKLATGLPTTKTVPAFEKGNVLVSNIRPYFKKLWLASFNGGRSNDVLAFVAKKKDWAEYIYNLCYQDSFFDFMMQTSKGAKMPRGDKKAIYSLLVVNPKEVLMTSFSKLVKSFYKQTFINNTQNESLSEMRDILLPKLLSGKIRLTANQTEKVDT